ncbi:MAG: hypothetical protein IKU17_06860 [Clostridia bacterium]|nr:hypothetical protein [Clostridia bacterium]
MSDFLRQKADEIIAALQQMPEVKSCTVYGSLANGRQDALSDIDIEIDVSGCDNGRFMLALPQRLREHFTVCYSDFAPSLVPEKYIVSVALDAKNPFLIADLNCHAEPNCSTVTRQQVNDANDRFSHTLKLWTINLKHFVRGTDCRADILRMARKTGVTEGDERTMLEAVLCWLEKNAGKEQCAFVAVCRKRFGKLT